jgi:Carboxypeptidase regulatory-like domain
MMPSRLTVATIVAIALGHSTPAQELLPVSRIHGRVLDSQGALVPGANVTLKRDDVKRTVAADKNGNFEMVVAVGVYWIEASRPGFQPFRRAAVDMIRNRDLLANVVLAAGPPHVNFVCDTVAPCEPPIPQYPRVDYDEFDLRLGPGGPLKILVRFSSKIPTGSGMDYESPYAMLSYDGLALYAPTIHLAAHHDRAWADGPVILENGKTRIHAQRVDIDLVLRQVTMWDGKSQTVLGF